MRNMAAALLLAHGVPMIMMGDEYGHSKGGNNNTYCHDSPLNWFDWAKATAEGDGFVRFFRLLVNFRCVSSQCICAGAEGPTPRP
jgi:isoamylase